MKQFRVFLTSSSFIENLSLRKTRNGFFSHVVVEELSRLGVKLFILCSGSRNTPLLQAVVERGFQHRSFSDERSAAYFCLGYSKVELACVICTSGTALANFLPASCEAKMSQNKLLLLSCDRPLLGQSVQRIEISIL